MPVALRNIQDIPRWSAFENDILKGEALYKNEVQVTETQFENAKSDIKKGEQNKQKEIEVVRKFSKEQIIKLDLSNEEKSKIVSNLNKSKITNEMNSIVANAKKIVNKKNQKRILNEYINELKPNENSKKSMNVIRNAYLGSKKTLLGLGFTKYKTVNSAKNAIKKLKNKTQNKKESKTENNIKELLLIFANKKDPTEKYTNGIEEYINKLLKNGLSNVNQGKIKVSEFITKKQKNNENKKFIKNTAKGITNRVIKKAAAATAATAAAAAAAAAAANAEKRKAKEDNNARKANAEKRKAKEDNNARKANAEKRKAKEVNNARKANAEKKSAQEAERKALNAKKAANKEKKKLPNAPIGKGLKPPTAPALPSGQVNQPALPGAVQTPATAPQGTGLLAGVAASKFLGRGKKKSSVPKTLNKQIQLANVKGNLRKLAFSTSNAMTTSNMIKTNFKLPPMTNKVSNTSVMQTAMLMTTMTNQFKKLMEAGSSKNSAFRKLGKKYHPNRPTGSKEAMQLLQSLKNNKKLNKEIQAPPEPPKNMKKLLNNQTPKKKGYSDKKTVNFGKKLREKAKEEANKKAKEEAKRKYKEEANKKAKEEANKKAKEEANKKAAAVAATVGSLGVAAVASKAVKKFKNATQKKKTLTRTQINKKAVARGKKLARMANTSQLDAYRKFLTKRNKKEPIDDELYQYIGKLNGNLYIAHSEYYKANAKNKAQKLLKPRIKKAINNLEK